MLGKSDNGLVDRPKVQAALRTHGIALDTNLAIIAFAPRNPNLMKLFAYYPFTNDLRGQLIRLPSATNNDNRPMRFDSGSEKVIVLPLSMVIKD